MGHVYMMMVLVKCMVEFRKEKNDKVYDIDSLALVSKHSTRNIFKAHIEWKGYY